MVVRKKKRKSPVPIISTRVTHVTHIIHPQKQRQKEDTRYPIFFRRTTLSFSSVLSRNLLRTILHLLHPIESYDVIRMMGWMWRFLHRDYLPCNILFKTTIVDWCFRFTIYWLIQMTWTTTFPRARIELWGTRGPIITTPLLVIIPIIIIGMVSPLPFPPDLLLHKRTNIVHYLRKRAILPLFNV